MIGMVIERMEEIATLKISLKNQISESSEQLIDIFKDFTSNTSGISTVEASVPSNALLPILHRMGIFLSDR